MNESRDAFYIGYKPQAGPALGSWLKRLAALVCIASPLLAIILIVAQHRFDRSSFEFGNVQQFSGTVQAQPYPVLLTETPDGISSSYLVGLGKFGADEEIGGRLNRPVTLEGTRIYRDDQMMIEVASDSVQEGTGGTVAAAAVRSLGTQTLQGEIVDSKCYLGLMKPGRGKPHRACAARCISGGIPPIFLVEDRAGNRRYLLLTGTDARALGREVLDFVAEPLEIEGEVFEQDGVWYLQAEPSAFRRLGDAP